MTADSVAVISGRSGGAPSRRRWPLDRGFHALSQEGCLVDDHEPQVPHGARVEGAAGEDIVVGPHEPDEAARAEHEAILDVLHVELRTGSVAPLWLAVAVLLGLRGKADIADAAARHVPYAAI